MKNQGPKPNKIRDKYRPEVVLATWRDVNQALPHMNEGELLAALAEEVAKPLENRRADIVHRLHRRFTKVRQERELQEYLS